MNPPRDRVRLTSISWDEMDAKILALIEDLALTVDQHATQVYGGAGAQHIADKAAKLKKALKIPKGQR